MGTKIVIPSDLKLSSIEHLRSVLQFQSESNLQVVLLHGIYLSNSITDLLFFDKTDLKLEIAGREFMKELRALENELGNKVKSIQVDFFSGFTQSSFNNYLSAIKADKAVIPNDFPFDWSYKKSMDILPYFMKCTISKQYLSSSRNSVERATERVYENAYS